MLYFQLIWIMYIHLKTLQGGNAVFMEDPDCMHVVLLAYAERFKTLLQLVLVSCIFNTNYQLGIDFVTKYINYQY